MEPKAIWIVTREGPEWSEIVGVYMSKESAQREAERCNLSNKGSSNVFDQLSSYEFKRYALKP